MLSRRAPVAGLLVMLAVAVAIADRASPPAPDAAGAFESKSTLAGSSACGQKAACDRRSSKKKKRGTNLLVDNALQANPIRTWGSIDCAEDSRHQQIIGGGDRHLTANGNRQGNSAYRRLTVIDGDDFFGERCELGWNRVGAPTTLYNEGQRRVTQFSVRLPANYPLGVDTWQGVMQMKQTQPSANGGGTPVISFDAFMGRWRLFVSDSRGPTSSSREIWSTPARTGVWTRFSFNVRYSSDPSAGFIKASVDLNTDDDFKDPGERSGKIHTYTLKIETSGGSPDDGIAPGQSIPSHLRVGVYHDPEIACPEPVGCYIDVDNVQVVQP